MMTRNERIGLEKLCYKWRERRDKCMTQAQENEVINPYIAIIWAIEANVY